MLIILYVVILTGNVQFQGYALSFQGYTVSRLFRCHLLFYAGAENVHFVFTYLSSNLLRITLDFGSDAIR